MSDIPQFVIVFQTSPEGYFEYAEKAKLLIPPNEQNGAPPLYAVPHLAVLVAPPEWITGHKRKYVTTFGPFEVERRIQGTWIQEPIAPPPVEELPGPTEESN